ncbi:hypothetical protein [Streptomyces odonnellii]|uniref:hypothetical protein n=1 Tax=Streptomyces odonnellii TaxID=1417980 RepID=UPI001E4E32F5|nr:hypothetical protein [Streptomyces odonnellii]
MHPTGPLPHVDLTDSQRQLLAHLVSASLPDPGGSGGVAEAVVAYGLDPDQVRADLRSLIWLKFVARDRGRLLATDLGAAVHFRSLYESAEERLSEIARLVEAYKVQAPSLTRCVRRLAQGSISFEEALTSLGDSD